MSASIDLYICYSKANKTSKCNIPLNLYYLKYEFYHKF